MSPRDEAKWNLRVKTAALETILEVVEFWFMSVLAHLCFCMRNEQVIMKFLTVFLNWCTCVHSHFIPPKIFQSYLANTEKLSWNIYCSLWMQECRFELYSTKVAVTRGYYLCIFWIINWETPDMTTDRGGEWYLEKRGSRKISARSRNLESVF